MLRADMLATPPEVLQGLDVDVEYVSPLARAQKSSSLNSTMQALEILLPLAQALPVAEHINADGLVNHIMDSLGVPKKVVNPQSEVDAVREEQAAQQEAMMARQAETQDVQDVAQLAQASRMISK